jgi:hypothetical protein
MEAKCGDPSDQNYNYTETTSHKRQRPRKYLFPLPPSTLSLSSFVQ